MKKRLLIKTLSLLITAILLLEAFSYTTETKAYDSDSDRVIVSLGDSFSSGEGIPDFYGQKDENGQDYNIAVKVKNEDWLAHRSTKSWPGRLTLDGVDGPMSENRDTHWFFAAVSGAETKHMKNKQNKYYNKKFSTIEGSKDLPAQLDIFNTLNSKNLKADYVTITIGGNDAGFADIISDTVISHSSYLYPGVLTKRINKTTAKFLTYDLNDTLTINPNLTPQEHLLSNFEITNVEFAESGSIYTGLCQAYEDIHKAAGDQAKIIVAGYPKLLNNAIALTINSDEVELINNAVSLFNYGIEKLVTRYRDTENMPIYFVSVEEAFEGHEAYSLNSAINPVILFPLPEDIDDRFIKILDKKGNANSPLKYPNPSAYSMHPDEYGAKLYAECVQAKIDELDSNTTSTTQSTTQQQSNNTTDSFYNEQFYQQQQYNNDTYLSFDKSTIYYRSDYPECLIRSADDIFSLQYNAMDCTYYNTSTDTSEIIVEDSYDTFAVTEDYIYYIRNGKLYRTEKTKKTNFTNFNSNDPNLTDYSDELVYDGSVTQYIISKKYIFILDESNLVCINHDGSNKKTIETKINPPKDSYNNIYFKMFTISENLYYVSDGQLYCYYSSPNTQYSLCTIPKDVYLQCAAGNKLYFLKNTMDSHGEPSTIFFRYTEGASGLTEYPLVRYHIHNLFADTKGNVYARYTEMDYASVLKIKLYKDNEDKYHTEIIDESISFSHEVSLFIYKNAIIIPTYDDCKFKNLFTF